MLVAFSFCAVFPIFPSSMTTPKSMASGSAVLHIGGLEEFYERNRSLDEPGTLGTQSRCLR